MKRVFKYPLQLSEVQTIVCKSSKLLSVAVQDNKIVVYAIDDTDMESANVFEVFIIGTGHDIFFNTNTATFLGTVNISNGFMFHVFYKPYGGDIHESNINKE